MGRSWGVALEGTDTIQQEAVKMIETVLGKFEAEEGDRSRVSKILLIHKQAAREVVGLGVRSRSVQCGQMT